MGYIVMVLLFMGGSVNLAVYRDMDTCVADMAKAKQTGTPETRMVHAELACIDVSGGQFLKGYAG